MMMNLKFITAMYEVACINNMVCFELYFDGYSHGLQISMISPRKVLDFAPVTSHIYKIFNPSFDHHLFVEM